MTQSDVNRAVARVTGETVRTVAELGFSLADPDVVSYDPEPSGVGGQTVDWDDVQAGRSIPVLPQRRRRELVPA